MEFAVSDERLRLVPSQDGSAPPSALAPVPRALPPTWAYVEGRAGARAAACLMWVVASALEPGQALPFGRYHPHYRLSRGPVGGSDMSPLE
jgi:hypothetical protein